MSEEQSKTQGVEQTGSTGEAASVGLGVGGVHNKDEMNWLDLWALNPETRAFLTSYRRDAACPQASQRSKGAGDGSQEILTPIQLQKLQRALYRKAKTEPDYRFWSLYGEEQALWLVERNGGAPGVDGQTIQSIKATPERRRQWLEQLLKELQSKTYRASPVRRVYIAKANGGQRPLGIPTVKDRVVQMAALLVLAPIFEADFHPNSCGFRPGRKAHDALNLIIAALRRGKLEVVDADLSKYFDTIPHDRLLELAARRISDGSILHLIRQWLKAPIVEADKGVLANRQGVPQGGVMTPPYTMDNNSLRPGWRCGLRPLGANNGGS